MIEALRKLTNGKKVLILGYGREGRATWQLLCRAGGCKEIAIADRNEKLYEEGAVMHLPRIIWEFGRIRPGF